VVSAEGHLSSCYLLGSEPSAALRPLVRSARGRDGRTDGRTDGWMDGWTGGWMDAAGCGAAALKDAIGLHGVFSFSFFFPSLIRYHY